MELILKPCEVSPTATYTGGLEGGCDWFAVKFSFFIKFHLHLHHKYQLKF